MSMTKITKKEEIMSEEINNKINGGPIKIFGVLLLSLPSLMFRFGRLYLRFKRDAKNAGKIFKKELMKQGLDKQTASNLTELYIDGSNLSILIQNMR